MKLFGKKLLSLVLALTLLVPTLSYLPAEEYQAAMSLPSSAYNDAKEFYQSAPDYNKNGSPALFENHNIYYATRAKLAANTSYLRYWTAGWTITVSSPGGSMSVEVGRGGKYLINDPNTIVNDGTYKYNLWRVSFDDLSTLCINKNRTLASKIFAYETLYIKMDAIMTTIPGGSSTPSASLKSETAAGVTTYTGTVYRFVNASEYTACQDMFTSSLESYRNIEQRVSNYELTLTYNIGTDAKIESAYASTMAVTSDGYLGTSTTVKVVQNQREFETLTTKPITGIIRDGYHLDASDAWLNDKTNTYFAAGTTYGVGKIFPTIGDTSDNTVKMTANWKPNTYTIKYDSGLSDGQTMASQSVKYGDTVYIKKCSFVNKGYKCIGWKANITYNNAYINGTKITSTGEKTLSVDGNTTVKNLTGANNATVTLTAIWEPMEYEITLGKGSGTGGTDSFAEKYTVQYQTSLTNTTPITSITPPTLTGYNFLGYYDGLYQAIAADGKINTTNTYYTDNTTIHALYEPKSAYITFDFQGGTDKNLNTSVKKQVVYDGMYPIIDLPSKDGMSFRGFYTKTGGAGDVWYDKDGVCQRADKNKSTLLTNVTLYAYWVDDVNPSSSISSKPTSWTNGIGVDGNLMFAQQGVLVTCKGEDAGSGIASMTLKAIDAEGNITDVQKWTYSGTDKSVSEEYIHTQEGVQRYTVEVVDKKGNSSIEQYNPVAVVQFDKTPPLITVLTDMADYVLDFTNFSINFDGSDYAVVERDAGLYDNSGSLICAWEDAGINVETDYTSSTYSTDTASPYYVLTNNYPDAVEVVLPEEITKIGAYAFYKCTDLKNIVISSGATSIGNYAFSGCTSLVNAIIPNNITSIGTYSFQNCTNLKMAKLSTKLTALPTGCFYGCTDLTTVTWPSGLTSIGASAFANCTSLTEVILPSNVKSIGQMAFSGCSKLETVHIPATTRSIVINESWGATPFDMCPSLKKITVDENNPFYDSRFDCNAIIETSTGKLIVGCGSTIIPHGTRIIGTAAFLGSTSISNIEIPEGVTAINAAAFYGCSEITSITLPSSLMSIGPSAFYTCAKLYSVVMCDPTLATWYIGASEGAMTTALDNSVIINSAKLASSLKSGYYNKYWTKVWNPGLYDTDGNLVVSYEASGLDVETDYTYDNYDTEQSGGFNVLNNLYPEVTTVVLPDTVAKIGDYAFRDCYGESFTKIIIPGSVTSIGDMAFGQAGVTSVIFSEGLLSIGVNAFSRTGIKNIALPNSVTEIGASAFEDSLLIHVSLPSGLTHINECAFNVNYIENIIIPNTVKTIGSEAFSNNYISDVKLPATLESLGEYAFAHNSLTELYVPANVMEIGEDAFANNNFASIEVADGNLYYDSRDKSSAIIETQTNTLLVGSASTVIPNTVSAIGGSAFSGCTGLKTITIPNSVTSIGSYAFQNCDGLSSITIPTSITEISSGCFANCNGLKRISLTSSIKSIGSRAFYGCSALTTITIPANVTTITSYAFSGCSKLTSVTFADTTTWYVGASASSATTAASSIVSSTSKAATYLRSTYASKYWVKR